MTATEAWRSTDMDFGSQLLNAQKSGAEAIYLYGGVEGDARIVLQAKKLGIGLPILGANVLGNQKFLDLAAESANGMLLTWGAVDPKNPKAASLQSKMRQQYQRDADVFVAHAYDAVYAIAEAMKKAGTTVKDRAAIQKAIREGTYSGAVGDLAFDQNGHNIRHIFVAQVVNGKFEIVD